MDKNMKRIDREAGKLALKISAVLDPEHDELMVAILALATVLGVQLAAISDVGVRLRVVKSLLDRMELSMDTALKDNDE